MVNQQDNILLVKNIPSHWDTKKLFEIFNQNEVLDVKVFPKEHYGFITFNNTPTFEKWMRLKQLIVADTLLDLSKGDKNTCLYIQIKNPSISPEQVNLVLDQHSFLYCDISTSRSEILVKFYLRAIAEKTKKTLEDSFGSKVCVSYADREILPIAIHLSFNKNQASQDIHAFNKLELEKTFIALFKNFQSERKDEQKGSDKAPFEIDFDIDLPYEKSEFKGYGTLVLTPSFRGMTEIMRILTSQQSVMVGGVLVRVSKHEYKKKSVSPAPSLLFSSNPSRSPSSSYTSPYPSSTYSSPSSTFSSYSCTIGSSTSAFSLLSPVKKSKDDDADKKEKEKKDSTNLMINNVNDDYDSVFGSNNTEGKKRDVSCTPCHNNSVSPHYTALPSQMPNSTSLSPPPSSNVSSMVSALRILGSSKKVPFFVPRSKKSEDSADNGGESSSSLPIPMSFSSCLSLPSSSSSLPSSSLVSSPSTTSDFSSSYFSFPCDPPMNAEGSRGLFQFFAAESLVLYNEIKRKLEELAV